MWGSADVSSGVRAAFSTTNEISPIVPSIVPTSYLTQSGKVIGKVQLHSDKNKNNKIQLY